MLRGKLLSWNLSFSVHGERRHVIMDGEWAGRNRHTVKVLTRKVSVCSRCSTGRLATPCKLRNDSTSCESPALTDFVPLTSKFGNKPHRCCRMPLLHA